MKELAEEKQQREILISVIIPAWNVEGYIEKCIQSVLASSYQNLEVIVVDDGSTDNTPQILAAICDKRLHVIASSDRISNCGNRGVSAARNTGLIHATGDYICFVDADDRIAPEMIETLFKTSQEYDSDITICNYFIEGSNGKLRNGSDSGTEVVLFEGEEGILQYLRMFVLKGYDLYQPYFHMGDCWAALYSGNLVRQNRLHFIEGLQCWEDYIFNLYAGSYAERIVRINKPLYYHNMTNADSLTAVKGRYESQCDVVIQEMTKFCVQQLDGDQLFLRGLDTFAVRLFLFSVLPACARERDYKRLKKRRKDPVYREAIQKVKTSDFNWKHQVMVRTLKHGGLIICYLFFVSSLGRRLQDIFDGKT